MAQIDSRIALGFQPTAQIESPVNNLARILQVQGAQQANQLNQLRMDEYQSGVQRKNKLAALLGGQYGSDEERESALLRGGFMDEANTLRTNRQAAAKSGVELDEKRFKLATDRYNTYKQTLGALSQNPNLSKDLLAQVGQQLVDAGIIPAEMHQRALVNMPDDPNVLRQRLREGVAAQMAPDKMLEFFAPKAEKIDSGQQIMFRDTNPNSPTFGQNVGGAPVQKMQTPDSIASNETTRRGQNMVDARARERLDFDKSKPQAQVGPDGRPAKPMPATALKMQNEALDMIGIASSIQADLGAIEKQLETGKLDFGPVKNVANNLRNLAGASTEQSRNFATFKSSMEKLRNDSLRLNKGVQTDGDAQRAWNELFQNINDAGLVRQRLKEINAINARAVELRKREVEDIRNNYNQPQYDFTTQTNVPSAITPPSANLSPQDKQAMDWANANPNDPRAAAIKQRLGVK